MSRQPPEDEGGSVGKLSLRRVCWDSHLACGVRPNLGRELIRGIGFREVNRSSVLVPFLLP